MGLRLRRSIKVFPGLILNLSKSGISASVGVRGAKVSVGKKGIRKTVGIPGTGLSYTDYHRIGDNPGPGSPHDAGDPHAVSFGTVALVVILVLLFFFLSR
jgi:hypothetical protein